MQPPSIPPGTPRVPAKRLGGFYFAYYAAIGVLVPYLGLYLSARGFSAMQIGLAMGALAVTRMFAPYGWGMVADKQHRMWVVRGTLLGGLLCFACLPLLPSVAAICAVLVLYGVLINGTMGQFEVVTFAHLGPQHAQYTRIRLWGSIGFLVLVIGLGPVLDITGISALPLWIALFFIAAFWVAMRIPNPPKMLDAAQSATVSVWQVLQQPAVRWLLLGCLLSQVAFGPYYSFYSIYLDTHGYSKSLTGLLWSLGVIAEVVLFWYIPQHMARLSLARMLVISQLATVLRWVLTPVLIEHAWATAGVQLLHAVSFGCYHLAAVNLIRRSFPASLQGRGQAIYIGVSYGAGGAIGGVLSGWAWERFPESQIWLAAALAAALAAYAAGKTKSLG